MKTIKSMFNLIEITMAIAVVGIGIAGIMALFPPAIEANRVANNENYIGGIVDSMAAMVENVALTNWSGTGGITSLPTSKATPDSTMFSTSSPTNYPGIYNISSTLFGVASVDGSFVGHIQLWRGTSVENYENPIASAAANSLLGTNSAKVFIELSWPLAAPYDNREKRLYVIELFKGE